MIPSQADVRKLLGDSNWYEGPPSFGVSPLDQGRTSMNVKFTVQTSYIRLGTAESVSVTYSVFNTVAVASTVMTNIQAQLGQSSGPRVGDQALYYGAASNIGGAPFLSHTFVRVGQIVVEVDLTRKDSQANVNDLARYAKKFTSGLQNLGKAKPKASPTRVDPKQLPPPGRDITLLGSANLPIEAFVVMTSSASPDNINVILQKSNLKSFAYGDYALNADTHMEVQTAFMNVGSAIDALSWAQLFGSNGGTITPDSTGLYQAYIQSLGEYHYVFAQGSFGIYIICKPAVAGEAASRDCEDPMQRTVNGWSLALQGLG